MNGPFVKDDRDASVRLAPYQSAYGLLELPCCQRLHGHIPARAELELTEVLERSLLRRWLGVRYSGYDCQLHLRTREIDPFADSATCDGVKDCLSRGELEIVDDLHEIVLAHVALFEEHRATGRGEPRPGPDLLHERVGWVEHYHALRDLGRELGDALAQAFNHRIVPLDVLVFCGHIVDIQHKPILRRERGWYILESCVSGKANRIPVLRQRFQCARHVDAGVALGDRSARDRRIQTI